MTDALRFEPASLTIAKGTTVQFTATGTFADNTTTDLSAAVTWASSSAATATVSTSGLAKAVGVGTATITAKLGDVTGTATLTVTSATLVSLAVTPPRVAEITLVPAPTPEALPLLPAMFEIVATAVVTDAQVTALEMSW